MHIIIMFDDSTNKTSLCFKQYQITLDDKLSFYFKNIFHIINKKDYSTDYLQVYNIEWWYLLSVKYYRCYSESSEIYVDCKFWKYYFTFSAYLMKRLINIKNINLLTIHVKYVII